MIFLYFSCDSDVSIIKRYDEPITNDTSVTVDVGAEPEDSPPPTDDFIDGYGGYFHFYLRQVACPSCFGLPRELDVFMEFKTYDPISDLNSSWVPAVGECTDNFFYTNTSTNPVNYGSVVVDNGTQQFFLNNIGVGDYYLDIFESQYDRNTNHDVIVDNETAFSVRSVEGFDYVEPYTLLWVDPSYAFETPISKQGTQFSWSPSRSGSIFSIVIAVYSPDGSSILGSASCSGPDNGSLYFPGQLLSSYPSGSLAAVHLTRHEITYVPSLYFNHYIEAHMEWEVVGTGVIY